MELSVFSTISEGGRKVAIGHEDNEQMSITTEILRYDENIAVVGAVTTTLKGSFPSIGIPTQNSDSFKAVK